VGSRKADAALRCLTGDGTPARVGIVCGWPAGPARNYFVHFDLFNQYLRNEPTKSFFSKGPFESR
jgi:hypothetical protein